jgi:iron complex outermembrane recepter protein
MKIISTACFFMLVSFIVLADDKKTVELNEFVVTSSPKESAVTSQLATTNYIIGMQQVEKIGVKSIKNLTAHIPNYYLPDYGSKITSSMYIRGIGSRMNEPAIGIYVDNIPYIHRSAFDIILHDIQQFKFLQGPQGTLYGRNTIGGLMNITTLSPLSYQGTRLNASYATYNDANVSVSHYQKLSDSLGISISGYAQHHDGQFTNLGRMEKNKSDEFGIRGKLEWKMKNKWQSMLQISYDYTDQIAYSYAKFDTISKQIYPINYNEPGAYTRKMLSSGFTLQRITDNYAFTSATGFQHILDRMDIDQDFTSDSIMVLQQNQQLKSITQEFVFRSNNSHNWQWVNGLFVFGTSNTIHAPMTFQKGGIKMIQNFMDMAKLYNPSMPSITITNNEMLISGVFSKPSVGVALYHQSSYSFTNKFSVTAGIRLDYEKAFIDYDTEATLHTSVKLPSPFVPAFQVDSTYAIKGFKSTDFIQVLPKVALHYKIDDQRILYSSLTKGYKAGGYNYSMFSDILQAQMQGNNNTTIDDKIYYKPEESWNIELGSNGTFGSNRFNYQAAIFYIHHYNQQLSTTTSNGSRMISNAELSQSFGAELSVKGYFSKHIAGYMHYGHTDASFIKYNANNVNYNNKSIPFAPKNTLSIGIETNILLKEEWLDEIVLSAHYTGIGPLYWDVQNTFSQEYYGIANGDITFSKNNTHLKFWVKNALNQSYNVFYFESLGTSFIQTGIPITFGMNVKHIL